MFITGPMKPVRMRARRATFFRRWLTTENCAVVASSRTKACTTCSPVMVSSMMPFNSPSVACVSRKLARVRRAMARVRK